MSTTNLQIVSNVLELADEQAIQDLLDDRNTSFWVDWREEEDAIPRYCEDILQTGTLSAEFINADTDKGCELHIYYDGKDHKVPLTFSPQDRHITICALNEILEPHYEIRFFTASNGMDSLAFVPLPKNSWEQLETEYGEAVDQHFYRILPKPNLFTDPVSF